VGLDLDGVRGAAGTRARVGDVSAAEPKSAATPAIAGGTPIRDTLLPFFRPEFGREEEEAVVAVIRSGWLATGPACARFEEEFQKLVGARHAITTSSCTTGLHLILHAAGIGPGDEVIVPAMTFPATANAVLHAGATPVLVDVLPRQLTIDPAAVRAAIGSSTRGIIAVHLAGWPAEMDALRAIADEHALVLIEDAAHAIGTRYKGRAAGTLGDAASFSFYANKNLTTCEGGMVTTADDAWARAIRVARLHGMDVDASGRDGTGYRHWEAIALGWKYNLNDVQAALGLAQLPKLAAWQARRAAIDGRYRASLECVAHVEPLAGPDGGENGAHIFPVLLDLARLRVDRDDVLEAMLAERIGVGVHYRALPEHRFFRDELGHRPEAFPVATDASRRTFSLPMFPAMTDAEVDQVVAALDRILRFYAR
jgi:dTDP-4-amino-4,6-dideoxygalactose transaminase